MKRLCGLFMAMLMIACFAAPASAQGDAEVQKAYDMALKAAYLLEQLGEEGLAAFNDPQGEFTWDGNYVFITDCDKGVIAAHPSPKVVGLDSGVVKCKKTGRLILKEACELAMTDTAQKEGVWIDYWWNKPGSDTPQRKVSFILQVPGTSYQVGSGIYNDTLTMEELNKTLH